LNHKSLRKAKVIPDVLDTFSPLLSVTLNWSSTAETRLGNVLPPSALTRHPDIFSTKVASAYIPQDIEFVLALTDPDAPSASDPKWGQVCHWLFSIQSGKLKEFVSYKPPGPPEGTGIHRYVVVVMVAANGTTEVLDLDVPSKRKHWGYDGERSGVKEFAKRNGLKVIGKFLLFSHWCFCSRKLYLTKGCSIAD
jgi:hypothetical protein